ncbi:MAG TPA: lytic polysaccharide monooxygenase [Streptosporangiaceae bacterium]|nr:lytic polysaccharide monooxygenase [Streptosporangiaceae bacterium]
MSAVRKIAALGSAPLVLIALAGPADAHGALTDPISRAAACGPEGGQKARSRACQAARAAGDAQALRAWDNLRVPGVAGRDRQMIPDGKLCSGGLDAYRGLDLPRRDWPATRLTSGVRFAFAYRTTIPHRGTFALYVTKSGYSPARRLKWSDLEPRPFAKVTDPPIKNGSYVIKGRLPRGKSGRHVIYTIWRNSGTSDTYYSCSDVVFGARGAGAGAGGAGKSTGKKTSAPAAAPRGTESAAPDAPAAGPGGGASDGDVNAVNSSSHSAVPVATGGGAAAVALAGGAALLLIRIRRRRRRPRRPVAGPARPGQHPAGHGFADHGEESW